MDNITTKPKNKTKQNKKTIRTRALGALRHGARSREIWQSPRVKNESVIKHFFSECWHNISLYDYKTKKTNAKSNLVS